MNIISLNIWGGRAGSEKILEFVRTYRDTIDVFCLQEVWADRYENLEGVAAGGSPIDHSQIMIHAVQDISAELLEYECYFHPSFYESYGLATFVRKGLHVLDSGEVFVHRERGYIPEGDVGHHARNIQYVTIEREGGIVTIINFHGLWNGKGKGDSPERLEQSRKIVEFSHSLKNPFVLIGDFNLEPDTKSIKMFEDAELRNLINEYEVISTRTSLYSKPGKFADYAFTSEGVEVTDFRVLADEVSDHAPLLLFIA